MNPPHLPGGTTGKLQPLFVLLFLATAIWFAHFLNFLHFGLYEDDYALVSGMWRWPDFLANTRSSLLEWPQGRPIGFLLLGLLSFTGAKLGGLPAIYLIGFAIITTNSFLFYRVLRKTGSELFAIAGALALGVYPADTTHSLLTHSLGLQTSITFFLLATLAWQSGARTWAWLAITGTLLTYETPFPVFLAVPLLARTWDRGLLRDFALNALVMAAILLVVLAVRSALGEERVAGIGSLHEIVSMIARAMIMGPLVSAAQFINGPLRALNAWNTDTTILTVITLAAFSWILYRSADRPAGTTATAAAVQAAPRPGQLLLTGIAMLMLAYVFSFTHFPPIATFGRGTSVHLASAPGGSIIFACICAWIMSTAQRYRMGFAAAVLLSAYLSLVMSYRLLIQDEFTLAWKNQQAFWTRVLELAPDIDQDTVIFVRRKYLPKTTFIRSNSWATPIILDQLYNFPDDWSNAPRVFLVDRSWRQKILIEGDDLKWQVPEATWFSHWETLPNNNLILLKMENGKLVRKSGSISIKGQQLDLRTASSEGEPEYPHGPLYDYLITD